MGYGQVVKAPGFELGIAGSNPAAPAKLLMHAWQSGNAQVCKTCFRWFESSRMLQLVRSVAQFGRASSLGLEGRGFKSLHSDQLKMGYGIAVVHRPFKPA